MKTEMHSMEICTLKAVCGNPRRQAGLLGALAAVASALVSLSAHSEEIIAPAYGFATNYVAAGEAEVQSDRVLVAYDGIVHKQGAGGWTIPVSCLAQPWQAAFDVADGTLSFGLGSDAGSYTAPSDLPSSVSSKALIWVDANDNAKVVRSGDAVSVWYDHRETDTGNPQYVRAVTHTTYTADAPEYAVIEGGKKAVYFGGLSSGRTMKFVNPNGSDCTGHYSVNSAVKQVFAVICNSNSYGNVFGAYGTTYLSPFRIGNEESAAKSLAGYYFYSSSDGNSTYVNEKMMQGRAYLNGSRIDPTMKTVEKGLQLIEAEVKALVGDTLVSGFFAKSSKSGSGGDYLCEALAFTNSLSEAERVVVEEYLMAKWLPQEGKRLKRVSLADNAVCSASVPSGETAEARLALSGVGVAEKTGDGELVLRNGAEASGVEWSIKGGSLTTGAFAKLKVGSGKRVTVDNLVPGPNVAVASHSDADSLEKDGSDRLVINGVPSGARRIRVAGGTLTVGAPRVDSMPGESVHEVPIRNGDFEEYAPVIASRRADTGRVESLSNMGGYGWSSSEGAAYVFDFDGWTTGTGAADGTRSAFNITSRPPAGKCALLMRCSTRAGCDIRSESFALAESGDYELRFRMCGRQSTRYMGGKLHVRLIAGSPATVQGPDHSLRYTYIGGYMEYRLRFPSMAANSYRINFRLENGFDGGVVIDGVRFYKVPSDTMAAARWAIPGGDFETSSVPTGAKIQTMSADWTVDGWTFTQPDGWTHDIPGVGVSTLAATNRSSTTRGVLYNNSREPEGGSMQLCFCGNGAAETSITPPAGTYRLEGFLSRFGSYGVHPAISASIVRANGTSVDLGMLVPNNKMMKRAGWPTSFSVDGSETVTLRLAATGTNNGVNHFATGILLDDVELVTATDLELFKGGDCEAVSSDGSGSGLKYIASSEFGCPTGRAALRPDGNSAAELAAFGSEVVDGKKMIAIGNRTYLYEDVAIPFAGRYRLSFYAKSRLNAKAGAFGPNPIEVSVNIGDATNILGRVNTYNSGWTQRVFDFAVPSGGTYRVAFQGMNAPSDANAENEGHIDAISLRQATGTYDQSPPFDAEAEIVVAAGARLETDFAGTNTVRRLRLGNVNCRGCVSASDFPEFLSGTGTFRIVPYGMVIEYR